MTINLSKGAKISLTKAEPGLRAVRVGLGWDERGTGGAAFDLDAAALMLNSGGRALSDQHFVFFNNLSSPDGSVVHTGDNRTGEGDGDDEVITVNLEAVPSEVERIPFFVSIYDAEGRGQNFGMVQNASIRVVDAASGREIVRYDLSDDFSVETAVVFGEVTRESGEWRFQASGLGYGGGLVEILRDHGLNV
jgi:tellurium resistance protein TerD